MGELALIKKEHFGEIPCDFYGKDNEVYMTIQQLAECLGYADRKGIEKLIERNPYLREPEFSVTDKLSATDGKVYTTRIFTEDGIYEVSMLARTERAREFRGWVRTVLKGIRRGQIKSADITEYRRAVAASRKKSAGVQAAHILTQIAKRYKGTAEERTLHAYAVRELTGEPILSMPEPKQDEARLARIRAMVSQLSYEQKVMLNDFLKRLEAERVKRQSPA